MLGPTNKVKCHLLRLYSFLVIFDISDANEESSLRGLWAEWSYYVNPVDL